MKIIGTHESGYIIDVPKDEMANLVGYYSHYDEKFRGVELRAGDEVEISNMYRQLYTLSNKKQELTQTVKALRNMADLLEPVAPVIEKMFDDVLKESGEGL